MMPHPGDALTQSHYSPKGGIYADTYYMGKKDYHLARYAVHLVAFCLVLFDHHFKKHGLLLQSTIHEVCFPLFLVCQLVVVCFSAS